MTLPNVRKLFIPDPGYILLEADLKGADALVVAKEANDKPLLEALSAKDADLHSKNATDIWGEAFTRLEGAKRRARRQGCKIGVHATNYGASSAALSNNPGCGFTPAEAITFQSRWFTLHPGVRTWHRRTEHSLATSRSVSNAFGYRIIYFDRIDGLLPQALAWVPQSTVAEVCFRGALALEDRLPFVEMLLQVHDSVVFQIPKSEYTSTNLETIRRTLLIPVPYPEPLIMPWKIAASERSWGECEEIAA